MFSGYRLGQAMDAQGRRQDWLAELLDVSPSYVSKLISGDKPVTEEIARTAAKFLGIPVDWLREPVEVSAA